MQKNYEIIISSGNLNDDYLEAEIFNCQKNYIGTVKYDGKEIVFDCYSVANNEPLLKRVMSLSDLVSAINDAMELLELRGSISYLEAHT